MSRAAIFKRLDIVESRLLAARVSQEQVVLEELTDEQLEGLEAWYEAGEPGGPEACWGWVESWLTDPVRVVADVELRPVKRPARSPSRVVEVEENSAPSVTEGPPLISEPLQAPGPVLVPSESRAGTGDPSRTHLLRSCDYVPRSPWAGPPVERGEGEEVTFRVEPLEPAYGCRPLRRLRRRRRT